MRAVFCSRNYKQYRSFRAVEELLRKRLGSAVRSTVARLVFGLQFAETAETVKQTILDVFKTGKLEALYHFRVDFHL